MPIGSYEFEADDDVVVKGQCSVIAERKVVIDWLDCHHGTDEFESCPDIAAICYSLVIPGFSSYYESSTCPYLVATTFQQISIIQYALSIRSPPEIRSVALFALSSLDLARLAICSTGLRRCLQEVGSIDIEIAVSR